MVSRILRSWRRWRAYRAAYRELASLDSRERDDLGLGFGRIEQLARLAAQATR